MFPVSQLDTEKRGVNEVINKKTLKTSKPAPKSRFQPSERRDLNPRPLLPQSSALPSCATPRHISSIYHQYQVKSNKIQKTFKTCAACTKPATAAASQELSHRRPAFKINFML